MKLLRILLFMFFLIMIPNIFVGIGTNDWSLIIFSSIIGGIFLFASFYLPLLIYGDNE